MRPHMPNVEELLIETSTQITRVQIQPLWISKIELDFTVSKTFQQNK